MRTGLATGWLRAGLLLGTFLGAHAPAGVLAATAAAAEPAPSTASAPASPVQTVAGSLAHLAASEALRRSALDHLAQAASWREIARRTEALQTEFDPLQTAAVAQTALIDLLALDHRAWALKSRASELVADISGTLQRLEHDLGALEADGRVWQERLTFLNDRLVPAPVVERARAASVAAQAAAGQVREARDVVLLDYARALAVRARIDEAGAAITARLEQIRAQRIALEESSLWALAAQGTHADGVVTDLGAGRRALRDYLAAAGARLALLFLVTLGLTRWLFASAAVQGAALAQSGYGRPLTASVLIATMALWWLAPAPPIVFYELLFMLAPIPAAMLARRTFAAAVPLTLYGLAASTMLLSLRNLIEASAVADRLLLLLQALCVGVPVAIDLRRGRLQQALPNWSADTVRVIALVVIASAVVAALHVFIGFSGPTRSLRAGAGSIFGFGLVFGMTAVALYGAFLALLGTPLLRWLRSARASDPTLLRAARMLLGVAAVAGVAIVTLGNLRLTATTLSAIDAAMDSTLELGALTLPVASIATAAGILVAAFVLTAATGFVLDREVFPRLKLRAGVGYAVATFVRWAMLIAGVMLALAALGVDTTKLTVVAGALGVGIGFGLQNVVNNFVAGLILIVERPVSVGDLIEIGPLTGEIKRIGIRSSSLRTTHGAEVVVPNSNLTSKEVINWTRSDRQRRYDIDVRVAFGSEPGLVLQMLEEAGREVPEILADPPPRAMFVGFGESSLDFRLLAWVTTIDLGLQAQNALRIAVLRRLERAGIAPFRQDNSGHASAPSPPAGAAPA